MKVCGLSKLCVVSKTGKVGKKKQLMPVSKEADLQILYKVNK